MVIPVEAKLKQIVEQQRDYPWPRPEPCPRCQERRVWGHGFVEAYFDEYPHARCSYAAFAVRAAGV